MGHQILGPMTHGSPGVDLMTHGNPHHDPWCTGLGYLGSFFILYSTLNIFKLLKVIHSQPRYKESQQNSAYYHVENWTPE